MIFIGFFVFSVFSFFGIGYPLLNFKFRIVIDINKRASLLLALRGWRTLCVCRRPRLTMINSKGDNISKFVCLTVIIDISRRIIKSVKFIMRNDDVITE